VTTTLTQADETATPATQYSLWDLVAYFTRLGTLGFGGPVALVGYMHRDLVEKRKWISESEYKEGLTLAQLMPGPLAAQLSIYLGYVHYSLIGATLVGVAFVLPSFLMVLAISWAYVAYGGLPWMQAVFYGVGPCVIAIIAISAYKLTKKTIGRDPVLWPIHLTCVVVIVVTESEWIALFLLAGVITWLIKRPPKRLNAATIPLLAAVPLLTTTAPVSIPAASLLWQITWFFTKAGAFVFGSGLAILPFLYGGVVKEYGWLSDQQFLDAVAVAMITPGPVVITVAFIGFLVAGLSGAVLAALGTFISCYFFTIVPAPYFKKHGKRPGIVAFVDGVTAAAVGAIAGAVIVLARRMLLGESSIPDVPKLAFLAVTPAILLRYKKLPEPIVVLCAAAAGLLIYPLVKS
jgi:chromate transporter